MVEMEKRTYRLTGFTPMLGSSPADPYVRTNYIASKAPDPVATAEEEREYLLEREENKITVLLRNPKRGALMLLDYQVMGFIKGVCFSTLPLSLPIVLSMKKRRME